MGGTISANLRNKIFVTYTLEELAPDSLINWDPAGLFIVECVAFNDAFNLSKT